MSDLLLPVQAGPRGRAWRLLVRRPVAFVAAIALALVFSATAHADVTAEGDVTPAGPPALPIDGGTATADIIVGGTGVIIPTDPDRAPVGRLVIDVPAFTAPLISPNGFIGLNADGVGEVVVSGFGSDWSNQGLLAVGVNGVGYLNITTGARVRSNIEDDIAGDDPDAIVGQEFASQGYVNMTGFGSQWVHDNVVVGGLGFGRVEAFDRSQIITRDEAIIGDQVTITAGTNELGTGYVLLDGRGTRWNVGDVSDTNPDASTGNLTVGLEGRGGLEIRNQALVAVEQDTLIGSTATSLGQVYVTGQDSKLWSLDRLFVGTAAGAGQLYLSNNGVARTDGPVAISARGLVQLATGGVIQATLAGNAITNAGIIRGDGRVEGQVINNGWLRNAALLADLREKLWFTGTVTNNGDVESIGGEMEFESLFNNNGINADILAKDAILRFNGGISNTGNVILDHSVVWSPGTFMSNAALVLESSESTLMGALNLGAANALFVELGVGNEFSRLDVSNAATLAGDLRISLTDDYVPRLGDAFEILEAGGVTGTFANVFGPGVSGFDFDVTYTPSSVIVNVIAGFVFSADFDNNNIVNGADLAILNMNFGTGTTFGQGDADGDGDVDGADLLIWQQQLGTPGVVAAAGAVPEPATIGMLLAAVLALPLRRRTREA